MKKPANAPVRRSSIISRRRLEESADRWWEVYSLALGMFTEHALHEAIAPGIPILSEAATSDLAVQLADMALDAYEERWPGV